MSRPSHIIIEGIDRVGKDRLIGGIQARLGYHRVLHHKIPEKLAAYAENIHPLRSYQEASFRTLFHMLCGSPSARIICNRAHLGEFVYAEKYRGYPGDYVFDMERDFNVEKLSHVRLALLVEDFAISKHFVDDGRSLGNAEQRQREQELFRTALGRSLFRDKRLICVTDGTSGDFKNPESVLNEVLL